jgi:hypothetical protein
VRKAFEFAKKLLKTGEIGSGQLSKPGSWLWPAFKISELALADFQKLREICYPIGAKDLNSPNF